MSEVVITSMISALVSIIVAVIVGIFGVRQTRIQKRMESDRVENEKISEQRKRESLLSMKLTHANTQLTIGVAMALKTGHANGEIEKGLKMVETASTEYDNFIREIANDHLQ